jgi:murein DD-endopeptidase MepM/ murein hydrolase activator NlpD
MNAKIVDISTYNHIRDPQLLKQTITGVLIRVGQKNFEDNHFREHVATCRTNNIPFGGWWFMHPNYSGEAQALKFLELYGSLGSQHRIFLDCENISYTEPDGTKILINPNSKNEYTHFISVWLSQVEATTGIVPGIYTAFWFWQQWVYPSGTVYSYQGTQYTTPNWSHYPLWVANWEVQEPLLPHGWTTWKFWQYGARVTPGIWNSNPATDQTDADRFNGTPAEAIAYLNMNGETPPPPVVDPTKIHLGYPCEQVWAISQRFGEHPENYQVWGLPGHEGLDFATPTGQPIYAMEAGTVSEIRRASSGTPYGNCAVLSHSTEGINYRTFYAHLRSCSVVIGQTVTKGQTVGFSDSTGNSSGPHLHITVKIVGYQTVGWPPEYIDPLLLISNSPPPSPVEGEVYQSIGNLSVRLSYGAGSPPAPYAEWLKAGDRRTIIEKYQGWGRFAPQRWINISPRYCTRIT